MANQLEWSRQFMADRLGICTFYNAETSERSGLSVFTFYPPKRDFADNLNLIYLGGAQLEIGYPNPYSLKMRWKTTAQDQEGNRLTQIRSAQMLQEMYMINAPLILPNYQSRTQNLIFMGPAFDFVTKNDRIEPDYLHLNTMKKRVGVWEITNVATFSE